MLVTRGTDSTQIFERIRSILARHGDEGRGACVVEELQLGGLLSEQLADARLVFLVLSDAVDRATESVARLQSATDACIIAVGAALEAKDILRVIRAGATDFICADDDLEAEVAAAIRRLIDRCSAERCGRIFTVTGATGGAGRSVVACNLAAALAKKSGCCTLCDLQYSGGDQGMLLNLTAAHTIVDLCRNIDTLDRAMFEQSLAVHECGVQLLASPPLNREPARIPSCALVQVLRIARQACPMTVLDINDLLDGDHADIMRQSDKILIVLRHDFPSVIRTCRALKYLESIGISQGSIAIVGNRWDQAGGLPATKIEECLGLKIDHFVPDDAKTVNASINVGVPAVIEVPKSKFTKTMAQLADCLAVTHRL